MRKGFTLLELMIVIIIIGILASLGIVQYSSQIEKARGAEARNVIGNLRTQCGIKYMEYMNVSSCVNGTSDLSVYPLSAIVPSSSAASSTCSNSGYYFLYTAKPDATVPSTVTFTATRCKSGGKTPNSTNSTAPIITYTADYAYGKDTTFGGDAIYF